ncbi:hypothetical protein KC19_VG268100 [Ceratodon purpureus]|uniref:Uncharacterized protein n=1 Tax=Ceratodon purpureus TaxID=3225 RepID=A0A8T0HUU8_CERPU|nr:hypothetical protein KC19_VG268100 [Ceratodon purpureus]
MTCVNVCGLVEFYYLCTESFHHFRNHLHYLSLVPGVTEHFSAFDGDQIRDHTRLSAISHGERGAIFR